MNRPAAYLAIFDVFLLLFRRIDEHVDAFAAVRAIDTVFEQLAHLPAMQPLAAAGSEGSLIQSQFKVTGGAGQ